MSKKMLDRKKLRKKGYDYTGVGSYFITICTYHREHFFGKINDKKMILNDVGKYTRTCRNNISLHHPYAHPGIFVCMPNHIHGIITITNTPKQHNQSVGAKYLSPVLQQGTPDHQQGHNGQKYISNNQQRYDKSLINDNQSLTINAGSYHFQTNHTNKRMNDNSSLPNQMKQITTCISKQFGTPSGSLSSIIRGFKIGITKFARKHDIPFKRQRSYHDHIIRDQQSFNRIRQYIITNPENRKEDRFS